MDRLTHKRPDGRIETTGTSYSEIHMDYVPSARINDYNDMRLAAYEDTGLTPEEIAELVNKSRSGEFFDAVELAQIAVNTQRYAELAKENAQLRAQLEQERERAESAEKHNLIIQTENGWLKGSLAVIDCLCVAHHETGPHPESEEARFVCRIQEIASESEKEHGPIGMDELAMRQKLEQAEAANAGMREALESVYPMVYGRALALLNAGEEIAGDQWNNECQKMIKALAPDAGVALLADVRRLRSLIDDIYPMIAGRVIQLKEAGEKKAAAQWNEMCQRMLAAKEGQ